MKCEKCGCENKENALFCAECGKALQEKPIELDLQQIKTPAAARKAHIVKVSAKKSEDDATPASQTEEKEESVTYYNPERAARQQLEEDLIQQQAQAETPAQEESAFIPLTGTGDSSQETDEAPQSDGREVPMKIRNWIPVFILSAIPCVNIIMLFVWSFSSKTNKSKKSFAQLSLIVWLIGLILSVAAVLVYTAVFHGKISDLIRL